jgi:hypothetical protein
MAKSALQLITAQAKKLQAKKPGAKWVNLVKEASRDYNAGKLGGGGAARKPAKRAKKKRTKAPRPTRVPRLGRVNHKRQKKAGGTVSGHVAAAKSIIADKISKLIVRQSNATNKRDRKAIGKEIAAEKQKLRNPFSK